jgi:PadR family transcriptional regulator PadR
MSPLELREPAFWILTVLARGRRHGYGIIEEARRLSGGRVVLRVATLYTTLERMAADQLIAADGDEIHDGRVRRHFRITDLGEETLRVDAERLAANTSAARAALKVARGQQVAFS